MIASEEEAEKLTLRGLSIVPASIVKNGTVFSIQQQFDTLFPIECKHSQLTTFKNCRDYAQSYKIWLEASEFLTLQIRTGHVFIRPLIV
jgi:hypothetical protein